MSVLFRALDRAAQLNRHRQGTLPWRPPPVGLPRSSRSRWGWVALVVVGGLGLGVGATVLLQPSAAVPSAPARGEDPAAARLMAAAARDPGPRVPAGSRLAETTPVVVPPPLMAERLATLSHALAAGLRRGWAAGAPRAQGAGAALPTAPEGRDGGEATSTWTPPALTVLDPRSTPDPAWDALSDPVVPETPAPASAPPESLPGGGLAGQDPAGTAPPIDWDRVVRVSRGAVRPPDLTRLQGQAHAALAAEDMARAVALYEAILGREPHNTRALFGLAVAQQRLGRDRAARATYEALLAREPNNMRALGNLLDLIGRTDPEEALRRLTRLQQRYPAAPAIQARRARLLAATGALDLALAAQARAVRLAPRRLSYRLNYAILLDRAGRLREAARAYGAVLHLARTEGADSMAMDQVRTRLSYLHQVLTRR